LDGLDDASVSVKTANQRVNGDSRSSLGLEALRESQLDTEVVFLRLVVIEELRRVEPVLELAVLTVVPIGPSVED